MSQNQEPPVVLIALLSSVLAVLVTILIFWVFSNRAEAQPLAEIRLEEPVSTPPPSRNDYVYIMGEVSTVKPVKWYEGMRLTDALTECGGFKRIRVKEDQIFLWRDEIRYEIDIKSFLDDEGGKDYSLKRGDTILLKRNWFAKMSDTIRMVLSPVTDVFAGMGQVATNAYLND